MLGNNDLESWTKLCHKAIKHRKQLVNALYIGVCFRFFNGTISFFISCLRGEIDLCWLIQKKELGYGPPIGCGKLVEG